MASKSKRLLLERPKRARMRRILAFVLLVAAALLCLGAYLYSSENKRISDAGVALAKRRFETELSFILGNSPAALSLPEKLRSRLRELHAMNRQGKLSFVVDPRRSRGDEGLSIMACACEGPDAPMIIVFAPWFNHFAETLPENAFRGTFAAVLYHESVHLERWPVGKTLLPEDDAAEELRAYYRTEIDVVRPMLEQGFGMMQEYVVLDRILRTCGDAPCDAFKEEIRRFSPPVTRPLQLKS
jgi:hypothetical protein